MGICGFRVCCILVILGGFRIMDTLIFQASIKDGKIVIPEMYHRNLSDGMTVEITIKCKKKIRETSVLGRLLKSPLRVRGFQPLLRDEVY
jgi:hypothetical protein